MYRNSCVVANAAFSWWIWVWLLYLPAAGLCYHRPAGDPTSSSLIDLFSLSVLLFTSFSPLLLPSPATTCADMGDLLAEGLLNGSDYRWDVNLKLSKILWLTVWAALNFEKLCPCPWHERRKFDSFGSHLHWLEWRQMDKNNKKWGVMLICAWMYDVNPL